MRMKVVSVLLLLWLIPLTALSAAVADAVVKIGGCSGVCVSDSGVVLTARHCRLSGFEQVTFPEGRVVPARRVWETSEPEGPVAFDCQGAGYPYTTVAERLPEIGTSVSSYGYPAASGRKLVMGSGTLLRGGRFNMDGNPIEFDGNLTDIVTTPGWSGGPLLNDHGEVIGLLSAGNSTSSIFVTWRATRDAYEAALPLADTEGTASSQLELVVFTEPSCTACLEFERDWRAGHFAPYRVTFCRWNQATATWTHPELRQEFEAVVKRRPPSEPLGFPTFWIRGTDEYRVGYGQERRGGLLGWISGVLRHIAEGLFGKPATPALPPAPIVGTPVPTPGPSAPKRPPELDAVLADVGALKRTVEQVARDISEFKDGGLITKLKNVGDLKRDKAEVLARVDSLKRDVTTFRDRFRTSPLTMLWGLLGLVTGALHRRFAG